MLRITQHESLLIRGGRVIDPGTSRDEVADVAVVDGVIVDVAPAHAAVIDATGWIICPGLLDLHVHLREPGSTHKETIETGTAAGAAGGFTTVACMPNTVPPLDQPDTVRFVIEQAERAGHCAVLPIASITRGRLGKELVDFTALREAGAVAFSDDGVGVEDDGIMQAAFEAARAADVVLIQHCEVGAISAGGVMHLGEVSRRLELPGLDPRSEEVMIERDIRLCRQTGGRYHVAHISTARAVQLVREAKAEGLPVTAEVCPHHLLLTHEACAGGDPNTKMHPPLRTQGDMQACRRGLLDGTIDCIATDHAPHSAEEKATGFREAPPGIVGLETAVGLSARALIETHLADWPALIAWFTRGPALVLNRSLPSIVPGERADLSILDPTVRWRVHAEEFESKGRNTPFDGWTLQGRAVGTVCGRRIQLTTAAGRENPA